MVTKMGFLNRFRRGQPARANSSKLNAALRAYAASIRTLRNAPGASKNSVIAAAKSNSNAVNGAIVNYVMNFNKAQYANAKAANVVPAAVEGLVPENAGTNAALQAARANNNLAAAQTKVAEEVKQANKYRGLSSENLARVANNFNKLNAAAKNNFRRAINEKMASIPNGRGTAYELLENIKKRIGGRTAAAFVGPVNKQTTPSVMNGTNNMGTANLFKQATAPNNRKNMLKNLTNETLSNNTKINATIKKIRGMRPNANWKNVNANGLTNAQKKVLNGLKQGKNYTGIVRGANSPLTGTNNLGTANLFKQEN
ncbi:hypothetical protein [Yellowstone lake phycodnavirus 3]|uniref:hypothetical protein n=1 Tax=Yellowstone lake phycodnavirus 3 TaxID=1586715 RepID=UPI0006EB68DB|nr:hypothetical protein AR677_gp097 [Yellowstone lake phycodnavirus 3]BAT22596.1 hypothetical protein [Yellowstone lake phycodnavirus 3]